MGHEAHQREGGAAAREVVVHRDLHRALRSGDDAASGAVASRRRPRTSQSRRFLGQAPRELVVQLVSPAPLGGAPRPQALHDRAHRPAGAIAHLAPRVEPRHGDELREVGMLVDQPRGERALQVLASSLALHRPAVVMPAPGVGIVVETQAVLRRAVGELGVDPAREFLVEPSRPPARTRGRRRRCRYRDSARARTRVRGASRTRRALPARASHSRNGSGNTSGCQTTFPCTATWGSSSSRSRARWRATSPGGSEDVVADHQHARRARESQRLVHRRRVSAMRPPAPRERNGKLAGAAIEIGFTVVGFAVDHHDDLEGPRSLLRGEMVETARERSPAARTWGRARSSRSWMPAPAAVTSMPPPPRAPRARLRRVREDALAPCPHARRAARTPRARPAR